MPKCQLSKKQRRGLEQIAEGTIPLQELLRLLGGILEVAFTNQERKLTMHYELPESGVRVELWHIRNAMDRHARGEMTTEQLAELQLRKLNRKDGSSRDQASCE